MAERYAVIGNPVGHSKSPWIHRRFAELTGEPVSYEALLAPVDAFGSVVERFRAEGGKGLNITLPFKQQAHALSDELSSRASSAGAVNTLIFDGARVRGDNTDGFGLTRDLTHNLGCALRGRRLLVLGAGGAARGVLLPLLEEQPASLTLANRSVDKARHLVEALSGTHAQPVTACGYSDLAGEQFDLVINATSAGLTDAPLPLPKRLYANNALAYDMVYGRDTAFMRQARSDGATRTSDGLGMLVEQAAESFFLWRGVRPPTAPVLTALRSA